MKHFALSIVLITLAITGCKRETTVQSIQSKTVRQFYGVTMSFKEGGVPSLEGIQRLSPLISSEFKKNLLAALASEERDFKRSKGEEPPLVEGALFYSLVEGPDRLIAVTPDAHAGPNAYLVTFEYGNPKDKDGFVKWNDRVILKNENGTWVVDDLELLGDWQFGFKGKLSDILRDVASTDYSKSSSQ